MGSYGVKLPTRPASLDGAHDAAVLGGVVVAPVVVLVLVELPVDEVLARLQRRAELRNHLLHRHAPSQHVALDAFQEIHVVVNTLLFQNPYI